MTFKVLTANRLLDGVSVWYDIHGNWVETMNNVFIARHDEAVKTLDSVGVQAVNNNLIVDVALIDVIETANGFAPQRLRERIRANGPTIAYGHNAVEQTIAA